MKDKKNKYLMLSLILIMGVVACLAITNTIPLTSLATDSGYDTDYGGGGSGGGDGEGLLFLIELALRYPLLTLIIIVCVVIYTINENKKKRAANGNDYSVIATLNVTEEDRAILLNAYTLFYNTQVAWTNFDTQKLRGLLTDELYRSYENQLESMQMKNQKNIMRDFKLNHMSIIEKKVEEGVTTICVGMSVDFYDYIIDCATNKVVRGSDVVKVKMSYMLTFVYQDKPCEICPNCGAPLTSQTYCEYCHSSIHTVSSEMRMSKKEAVAQRTEGE